MALVLLRLLGVTLAVAGAVVEIEQAAQLREGGRSDPWQLVKRLGADLTLAAQLEDLVGKLGADPGLDQLLAAGGVHAGLGHRVFPQGAWDGAPRMRRETLV